MEQNNNSLLNLKKYLGYKFYKEKPDGNFVIKRIIRINSTNSSKIKVVDENNKSEDIDYIDLKSYTPLEPYGLAMFNIISTNSKKETKKETIKDVLITVYKDIDIKIDPRNIVKPYIICRQAIVDIFNDLNCQNPEDNDLVGLSITKDNCPTQINYFDLTACDDIEYSIGVAVYRDDNIDSIIQCIPEKKFNTIFYNLYTNHCKSSNPLAISNNVDKGWCKDIKTFLKINNFMDDFNSMCNMTGVDFNLKDYLIPLENEDNIYQLNEEALLFFNLTFKINAVQTRVIKYDYSINLGDFNNNNYTLLRDNQNNIYIIVYLVQGEYLEEELQKKAKELSLSEKLRLNFYNKYKNYIK